MERLTRLPLHARLILWTVIVTISAAIWPKPPTDSRSTNLAKVMVSCSAPQQQWVPGVQVMPEINFFFSGDVLEEDWETLTYDLENRQGLDCQIFLLTPSQAVKPPRKEEPEQPEIIYDPWNQPVVTST